MADRKTKLAKTAPAERSVFGLYSLGVITARDEWVYDFEAKDLGRKVQAFINEYEGSRALHSGKDVSDADLGTVIKWTRDLKRQLRSDIANTFDSRSVHQTLFRPFVNKALYFNQNLNEMQYQIPQIFPSNVELSNKVICFSGIASSKPFSVLATDKIYGHDTLEKTQCLPLYRYTAEGEQVSNITEWGLRQFREHYGDESISAEDIFAYTYAALHDPAYRETYAVDLLREFPRLPFHPDFAAWVAMGQELLDQHIGFESAEPYPLLERMDKPGDAGKAVLRTNKEVGTIVLDGKTTLTGVPAEAWQYQLGNRSALEWVLDQYKEKTPRDPTIRERFNTYRFADHKERVIDLLQRVCTVSVETVRIVDQLNLLSDIDQI